MPYPFFLGQYALIAAPALLFLALLGAEGLTELTGDRTVSSSREATSRVTLALSMLALAVTALPETQLSPRRARRAASGPATTVSSGGKQPTTPLLRDVHRALRGIREPAVVLFRFTAEDPFREIHEEPVYNIDVADPDQARIIHAHDLGLDEDRRLIGYYARTQPTRIFFIYVRKERRLIRWGKASDLEGFAVEGKLAYPK